MPNFSREDAYELVWAVPMRHLASRFEISDVALRRSFLGFNIPIPPQGYWIRFKAGKFVKRTALPPRGPGMPYLIWLGPYPSYGERNKRILYSPAPQLPVFEDFGSFQQRVFKQLGNPRAVRTLSDVHPAVSKLLTQDDKRRQKYLSSSFKFDFDLPFFDSAFERRRLRILNSIFRAVARFGNASFGDPKARRISVSIGAHSVQIWLDHPNARANQHGEWQTRSGKADELKLVVGSDWASTSAEVWKDQPEKPLERQIAAIAFRVICEGEMQLRKQAEWLYRSDLLDLVEARKEFIEARYLAAIRKKKKRRKIIENARNALISYAKDHSTANEIRALMSAVAQRVQPQELIAFDEWKLWAAKVAEEIDPLNRCGEIVGAVPPLDD